jgi:hypothetical protein
MFRPRARSKNAYPSPPLCETTETWPLPSGRLGRIGPALTSIAGLKVGQSPAAMLEKPSELGPITAMS